MNEIKIAILGCGRIAQRHAHHISKTPGLILAAVCDTVKEKAEALAKEYNSKAFYSLTDMLKSDAAINLVSVCTPNGLHAEQSIEILNSGKHVLCEKPMAIDVQDCGAMIQAAEKSNKRLFVIKQNRFNPPVQAVKRIIEEGRLGKIYSC